MDTKISMLLRGEPADFSEFMERLADFCAQEGYGTDAEEGDVNSVIYAASYEWPDTPTEVMDKITAQDAQIMMIPMKP